MRRKYNLGASLILVLAALVLLAGLVIAFFSSVTTDLTASRTFSDAVSTRGLADSVVNVVMSQIREATKGANAAGQPVAWASQPGLIRSWDQDGNPLAVFRLYSSDQMVAPAASLNLIAELDELKNWKLSGHSCNALYADLNSPVVTADNQLSYPVMDPAAEGSVEGFAVRQANSFGYSGSDPGPSNNPAPMPVRWLYVLADGTLTSAAGTSTEAVIAAASRANPVIGRVAFWTDDESCKVNLNTASEGHYWTPPVSSSIEDRGRDASNGNPPPPLGMAAGLPAQNEFHRVPGHPATTSLSAVFGTIFPRPKYPITSMSYSETDLFKPYFTLAPRVIEGGSIAGTVPLRGISSSIVPIETERLYASVDELMFHPRLDSQKFRMERLALESSSLQNKLTKEVIERARFFVSTCSRAPETNLWNKPRVCIWPIQQAEADRNAKDTLLAFCSRLNSHPFYFERTSTWKSEALPGSAYSTTADYTARNQEVIRYLADLLNTPAPGLGGILAGASSGKYQQKGENLVAQAFDYVRSTVNTRPAGLAPNYAYAGNGTGTSPQSGVAPIILRGTIKGFGRAPLISEVGLIFYPVQFKDTTRFRRATDGPAPAGTDPNAPLPGPDGLPDDEGKFDPVTHQLLRWQSTNPAGANYTTSGLLAGTPVYDGEGDPLTTQFNLFILLEAATVTPGNGKLDALKGFQFVAYGLENFKANGTSFNLPGCCLNIPITLAWGDSKHAIFGVYSMMGAGTSTKSKVGDPTNPLDVQYYSFVGRNPIDVTPPNISATGYYDPANGGLPENQFNFSGGTVNLRVRSGYSSMPPTTPGTDAQAFYEAEIAFPSASLPIPVVAKAQTLGSPTITWRDITYGGPRNGTAGDPHLGARTTPDPQTDLVAYHYETRSILPWYNRWNYTDRNGKNTLKSGYTPSLEENLGVRNRMFFTNTGNEASPYTTWPSGYKTQFKGTDFNVSETIAPVLIRRGDTVRSARISADGPAKGDLRVLASLPKVISSNYTVGAGYPDASLRQVHALDTQGTGLGYASENPITPGTGHSVPIKKRRGLLVKDMKVKLNGSGEDVSGEDRGVIPPEANGVFLTTATGTAPGDWDTGLGSFGGGPFINRADDIGLSADTANYGSNTAYTRYYLSQNGSPAELGYSLNPSRQIASPVQFGSFGAGAPWQTLLFCPNPAAGDRHPGFGTSVNGSSGPAARAPYSLPPDHLFLDLFWMPVVEPYAISEPLSTAGKINLNYQIAPFTYIERSTALHALLKSTLITAIPTNMDKTAAGFKNLLRHYRSDDDRTDYRIRYGIDVPKTLTGFEARFNQGDLFRSGSEICGLFLIPQKLPSYTSEAGRPVDYPLSSLPDPSILPGTKAEAIAATMDGWWSNMQFTGDNVRENPYNHIYPRVTTKSNVFTVHYRVQILKGPKADPTKWREGRDPVVSEYRGSSTLERYIDPNDADMPDFATASGNETLDDYYRFRVLSTKRFSP